MNALRQPTLEDRILTLLTDQGSVHAREIGRWLSGYDRGALDAALVGLMKRNRITLALNHYSLAGKLTAARLATSNSAREGAGSSTVGADAPPTAAQEAASALKPPTKLCRGPCGRQLPANAQIFYGQPQAPDGLDSTCKECRRQQQYERAQARKLARATVNRSAPERSSPNEARHSSVGVIDRDEAASKTKIAVSADDTAERRGGCGDDTAEPTPRSAEPEKGDRQSSEDTLGKVPSAQWDTTARSVRGAVMNPPESAAQGSEAGNRTMPHGENAGPVRPQVPASALQLTVDPTLERVAARRHALIAEIGRLEGELQDLEQLERLYRKFAGAVT